MLTIPARAPPRLLLSSPSARPAPGSSAATCGCRRRSPAGPTARRTRLRPGTCCTATAAARLDAHRRLVLHHRAARVRRRRAGARAEPGVLHVAAALTYTLLVLLAALLARGRARGAGRLGQGADRGRGHGRAAARRRRPRAARPARPRGHPGADPGHLPGARAGAAPLVHPRRGLGAAHRRHRRRQDHDRGRGRAAGLRRAAARDLDAAAVRAPLRAVPRRRRGRGARHRPAAPHADQPGRRVHADAGADRAVRAGRRARPPVARLARDPEPVRRRGHRRHRRARRPSSPGCTPRASPSPWPRSPSWRGTCPPSATSRATCSPWGSSSTWPGSSRASSPPRRSTRARSRRCSRSARCWRAGSSGRGSPRPPRHRRAAAGSQVPRPARPGCPGVRPSVAALAVAGACQLAALGYGATRPAAPDPEQALAGWLAAHGLTAGLGTFTDANLTTLDSGGAVRVLAVSWVRPGPPARPPVPA